MPNPNAVNVLPVFQKLYDKDEEEVAIGTHAPVHHQGGRRSLMVWRRKKETTEVKVARAAGRMAGKAVRTGGKAAAAATEAGRATRRTAAKLAAAVTLDAQGRKAGGGEAQAPQVAGAGRTLAEDRRQGRRGRRTGRRSRRDGLRDRQAAQRPVNRPAAPRPR